ncbi:MAG: phosphatidate cytidylyltransferase [Oscillospiraceae bacterium]|nr:phosphatidate cytidylyltransferase [Oscillospiraceae bacterium]
MLKRTISGVVFMALVVAVLVYNLRIPVLLNIVLAVVACFAVYEILVATKYIKKLAASLACFAFTAVLQLIPIFGRDRLFELVGTASVAFLLVLFSIALFSGNTFRVDKIGMILLITSMVAFPFFSALYMYWRNPYDETDYVIGQSMVAFCFLVAWMTDVGAYFAGFLFGKHKLCPKISPKKTVEGAIGGVIFCLAAVSGVAWLLTNKFRILPINVYWGNMLIVIFCGSLASMMGDLSFSLIKRLFGTKDFGNIMPGHGGVLDRFDSVLFVAPLVCVMNFYLPVIVH